MCTCMRVRTCVPCMCARGDVRVCAGMNCACARVHACVCMRVLARRTLLCPRQAGELCDHGRTTMQSLVVTGSRLCSSLHVLLHVDSVVRQGHRTRTGDSVTGPAPGPVWRRGIACSLKDTICTWDFLDAPPDWDRVGNAPLRFPVSARSAASGSRM